MHVLRRPPVPDAPPSSPRRSAGALLSKRVLDVVAASVLLLLTLPVLVLAAALIRLESPGPVLFRQDRVGTGGRRFTIMKLRTMRVGGDDAAHMQYVAALVDGVAAPQAGVYKLEDDRRTRVGELLRRSSMDELPQLLNVLGGSMSLVGPRPSTPEEADLWDERARQRLQVKPGITGLWQVSGRSRLTYEEMVDLDLRYAAQPSIWLDLRILARTPFALLRAETA